MTETRIATPAASAGVSVTTLENLPDDIDFRHATGFGELDRVLCCGLVSVAVVLLGGDPGVGL